MTITNNMTRSHKIQYFDIREKIFIKKFYYFNVIVVHIRHNIEYYNLVHQYN